MLIARMISGVILVLVLAGLAGAIALGQVEEKTSYGLMPLVVALSNIGVIWANWAFHVETVKKDS